MPESVLMFIGCMNVSCISWSPVLARRGTGRRSVILSWVWATVPTRTQCPARGRIQVFWLRHTPFSVPGLVACFMNMASAAHNAMAS